MDGDYHTKWNKSDTKIQISYITCKWNLKIWYKWTYLQNGNNSELMFVPKNWFFWTIVLEKTLEGPLDSKEIQPVNPKGNQPWILIGRTDAEAETPILWSTDVMTWLIGKDPDAGKDWRLEEKGTMENEMVVWHHHLNGHEFEQALGVGNGQGSLVCCSPWGHKVLDMTEQLNWTECL